MSTTAVSAFAIEEYRDTDEPAVLDLLHQCLGTGTVDWRDGRVWRWKHMDNPAGRSLVLVARAPEGNIMGLRAFMRWEMTARDEIIRAYRPVDTATDPEYRRLGIFSALTKAALQRARDEGVALTFNTPNAMSMPGYLKMGWRSVTPVRNAVKVTSYPRFLFRSAVGRLRSAPTSRSRSADLRGGAESVRAVLDSPAWVDALVRASQDADAGRISCRKTADYLQWRYLDDPVYAHAAVRHEEANGTRGCCFVRPIQRSSARGLLIEDLFVTGQRERASRALMAELASRFRPDFLMTYFSPGSSLNAIMRRLGFLTPPQRGSNFVVNPLGAPVPVDLLRADSWALAMGEVEFF